MVSRSWEFHAAIQWLANFEASSFVKQDSPQKRCIDILALFEVFRSAKRRTRCAETQWYNPRLEADTPGTEEIP